MADKKIPKKDDVLDILDDGGGDIGLDDKSSSIVVANLNATTLPMCVGTPIAEIETDDINLLFFMIDESPSMEPVRDELIDGFNKIVIPGIKGGSSKLVNTVEVGGVVFGESVRPLWGGGFRKIEDLPELTGNDYDTDRTSATALHQAVLDGLTAASVRAAEIMRGIGIPPRVWLVVLSDGANNCRPIDPKDVKKLADALSNEIFVKVFAGFETYERVDFREIAEEIGFGKPFEMKRQAGESDEDMGRRFRHLLGILSSSIVNQVAKQGDSSSSSSFWQD